MVEPAEELEDAAKKIQSNFRGYKARQRLRREDAMQRTTISMERAFADNGIRHTGEFHDCIPLPFYDTLKNNEITLVKKTLMNEINDSPNEFSTQTQSEQKNLQKECGLMYEISPSVPIIQFGMAPKVTKLVDVVVLTRDESAVQSGYLNFITSVEDSKPDPSNVPSTNSPGQLDPDDQRNDLMSGESAQESAEFSPRKGVIIEEITSLEEAKILEEMKKASEARDNVLIKDEKSGPKDADKNEKTQKHFDKNKDQDVKSEVDIVYKKETHSTDKMENKLLHYGSEDYPVFHELNLTPGNPIKSLSLSQESQLAGERYESPVTMMQIVPPTRSESLARDDSSDIASNDEKTNVVSLNTEGIKDQRKLEANENLKTEEKQFEKIQKTNKN